MFFVSSELFSVFLATNVLQKKPRGLHWSHFTKVSEGGSDLKSSYRCRYCTWEAKGDACRLREHLESSHPELFKQLSSPSSSASQSPPVAPSPPGHSVTEPPSKVQRTLLGLLDRPFTPEEQAKAVRKLALAAVSTSTPFSTLEA